MDERNKDVNDARRRNPALNQSDDRRDPSAPATRAERMAGHEGSGDPLTEAQQAERNRAAQENGEICQQPAFTGGLNYNGEFKVGKITIAPGTGTNIELRHENYGLKKMVAEATISGLLEERFFTDKTEAAPDSDV